MYVTFTRRGIAAAIALLLLVTAVCSRFSAAGSTPQNGSTNAQRVQFITSLGIKTEEECIETAEITIPSDFGAVYERYNKLQLEVGYDLRGYKGCAVTRYTYLTCETPKRRVNILVYKGRVIGGDISDTALEGSMSALKK